MIGDCNCVGHARNPWSLSTLRLSTTQAERVIFLANTAVDKVKEACDSEAGKLAISAASAVVTAVSGVDGTQLLASFLDLASTFPMAGPIGQVLKGVLAVYQVRGG